MTTTPAALLAESLASFSKSIHQTFTDADTQYRSEVATALSDAREARKRRDEAIAALHEVRLEGQGWKQEVITCKASLKQAEMTIAHQTETISQLRREATQWKDQSRNWQEHFLRVEQERCALSTRIDELIAERLHRPMINESSHTQQSQCENVYDSAPSSTTTKRASTSSLNQPPAYKSAAPQSPQDHGVLSASISTKKAVKPIPKRMKSSKAKTATSHRDAPVADSDSSKQETRPGPRQTVIRRVQAIIHVKEEESDEEDSIEAPSISATQIDVGRPVARKQKIARKKRTVRDDDDWNPEGNSAPEKEASPEEVRPDYSDDGGSDEDELMLGAENNRRKTYASKHVTKESPSRNKKRKLVSGPTEKPTTKKKT